MDSETLSPKTITVVVIALDEEVLIEETVRSILSQVQSFFVDYEIILVNDGSRDKTGSIMEVLARSEAKIKVMHNPKNIGLGASFQRALKDARFTYFMMLCGDGGLPAESLPAIFAALGKADLVIPYITNLDKIKSKSRYLLSKTYIALLNFFFSQKLHYYNGLPVYRLDFLRKIKIKSTGFGFQGEIITKLLKMGCRYIEIGVMGSEKAQRSRAVSVKNFINVGKTFIGLIFELAIFKPESIKQSSIQQE